MSATRPRTPRRSPLRTISLPRTEHQAASLEPCGVKAAKVHRTIGGRGLALQADMTFARRPRPFGNRRNALANRSL